MALPEPPSASRPLEARSRSLSQIGGGLRPTSLVERGAEGALPPRPTECGLQGGRAARLRRSHRDPLARSPATPARIPPPAPPASPTGRGHGEALTPPETRAYRWLRPSWPNPGFWPAQAADEARLMLRTALLFRHAEVGTCE